MIPSDQAINGTIMQKVHAVPYAGHLGYQRTLKQIQRIFYWPNLTLEVRDFVLGCGICQKEKCVHRLPAGFLEPLEFPEQKWADVSMDSIMGLHRSDEGIYGILPIVDRATKMVHLVPVQQTISASETV